MNIEKSLNGLVKNNNGKFRSKKQSTFILSQCNNGNNEYIGDIVNFHRSSTYHIFHLNERGVTKVIKHIKPNQDSSTYEREVVKWIPENEEVWVATKNKKEERMEKIKINENLINQSGVTLWKLERKKEAFIADNVLNLDTEDEIAKFKSKLKRLERISMKCESRLRRREINLVPNYTSG